MVSVMGPWFIPLLAGEPQNQYVPFFVMYMCRSHTMYIHMTAMNKTGLHTEARTALVRSGAYLCSADHWGTLKPDHITYDAGNISITTQTLSLLVG